MPHPCKIAIIDYEMGNLFSVQHACEFVGLNAEISAEISNDKNILLGADAAILPGVGAFGQAMKNLERLDLVNPIKDFIASNKPFMGICLGLQLLLAESEEFGTFKGLGMIKGSVVKFPNTNDDGETIKIPQIGWNTINKPSNYSQKWEGSPLRGIDNMSFMYFVHSYYVVPDKDEDILTDTTYKGINYTSSCLHNNIFAVQFHPEKSGAKGVQIYQNWADDVRAGIE